MKKEKNKKLKSKKNKSLTRKNKIITSKNSSQNFDFSASENEYLSKLNSSPIESISSVDQEKYNKLLNKNKTKALNKILEKDKFSKNVIMKRKKVKKTTKKIKNSDLKRIQKCNKYLVLNKKDEKEIYLTIDKFNNNGKKTIVYFIDCFYPCVDGVLSVMENYINYMKDYYNIVVCAPKHKGKAVKFNKYFVLFSDSIYLKFLGYDLAFPQFDARFQKFVSLLKIDLVHIQSPFNLGNFGLSLAKKRKVPCFVTFHSQFKKDFYEAVKSEALATMMTKIIMNIFEKATLVLTMNPFAEKVLRSYGFNGKVEIVPNATNLVPKKFDEAQENEILLKHGINKNIFNMIFVGRFVAVKNVYFILDVLKKLHEDGEKFNFIFLGYGPEEEKMKKKCKEYKIDHLVKFTGRIINEDEKAIIIKSANLMFFPSEYETDGIVRMEAACYSVPTLCLENTSLSSVLTNDRNGFVCKKDILECANKIKFLIKNVDFTQKIGKNANLELYFTWEKPCSKLNELYKKYLKPYHLDNSKKNKNNSAKNI